MKQYVKIYLATLLMLLLGNWNASYAGTYASGLRVTNPDTVTAFDGSFHDGTGARLWFTLNGFADTVRVRIKLGPNVLRTFAPMLNDTAGTYSFMWDGKDDSSRIVPMGRYTFEVFTSDTGNSTSNWVQAWQNKVRPEGSGLSNRDVEVVTDPGSPWFGNIILSESGVNHARLLVANAAGYAITEFGSEYFPSVPTGVDPWYMSTAPNGNLYVAGQTGIANGKGGILAFHNDVLVQTITDTVAFPLPRGIAAYGPGNPSLLIANGNQLIRRTAAGVSDTVFQTAEPGGYVRDVIVDDSGFVYVSFGPTSTYSKLLRGRLNADSLVVFDTLTFASNVTHLNIFRGSNRTSNADDILYARVAGASGGVFVVDFAAKTSTKLFAPSTSSSAYHAIATDFLGNIYYANPSNEWVAMYVPPMTAPTKWVNMRPIVVATGGTRIIDNFNATAGHFGTVPTYSGSTTGVDPTSTSKWVGNRNHSGGMGGAMEITLVDNAGSAANWGVRYLSGVGSVGANDSLAPFGFIGYWMRTSTAPPGATVAIGIDDPADPATKRSVPIPVINDGEWHLYQWNIENPDEWTPWVVTSGKNKIVGPRASIDAVWFFAPDGSAPWVMNFDDVSYNPYGMIGIEAGRGDITGNGNVSALDASWVLQSVVSTRTLNDIQTKLGDVNLSDEGRSVDALDASVMLGFVVGKIPFLPWVQPLPPLMFVEGGEASEPGMTISNTHGKVGQIVTIPVSIQSNLAGLRSAQMKLLYNSSEVKIKSIKTTNLTKDFEVAANIQNGYVNVAMANSEALAAGGQIFVVELEVLKTSDNICIQAENVKFNDKNISSVTSVGAEKLDVPTTYSLQQNYPNPFNPSTTIEYRLPQNGLVQLKIYDVAGREVATLINEVQNAGSYHITWNATDVNGSKVASGVYFYRLTSGNFSQIKKMMLLK